MSDVIESNLAPPPRTRATMPTAPKTMRILLEENDNIPPSGLPIGLNGKLVILRAGEEADVPLWVVGVLDNAVGTRSITDNGGQIIAKRDQLAFPYRVIRNG